MGYTVTLEHDGRGSTWSPLEADDVELLVELFEQHAGAVSVGQDGRSYGVTLSAPADECPLAEDAATWAAELLDDGLERAGLPRWPVVRLEVVADELVDQELERDAFPELLGVAELADLLGVSRSRASAIQVSAAFPAPVAVLRAGPVWARPHLEAFLATWERRVGRPAKRSA